MRIDRRIALALAFGSFAIGACGDATPPMAAVVERETSQLADLTRASLIDADKAAAAYGQAHLGHYVDMKPGNLRRQGLALSEGISLRIRARHNGYCIIATNEALPSIHPWADATVSSDQGTPTAKDRCQR